MKYASLRLLVSRSILHSSPTIYCLSSSFSSLTISTRLGAANFLEDSIFGKSRILKIGNIIPTNQHEVRFPKAVGFKVYFTFIPNNILFVEFVFVIDNQYKANFLEDSIFGKAAS